MKQVVLYPAQGRWSEHQAVVASRNAGYAETDDWAADLGLLTCSGCRDFIVEPAGWAGDTDGVLCSRCAALFSDGASTVA